MSKQVENGTKVYIQNVYIQRRVPIEDFTANETWKMHEKLEFLHTYIPFLPHSAEIYFRNLINRNSFLSLVAVPRAVLKEQYQGDVEVDEVDLMHQFEEGFDRADFRAEFSPSPNLEGPQSQPRDNVSRNFPTVSSSPPRARTNNDGE